MKGKKQQTRKQKRKQSAWLDNDDLCFDNDRQKKSRQRRKSEKYRSPTHEELFWEE